MAQVATRPLPCTSLEAGPRRRKPAFLLSGLQGWLKRPPSPTPSPASHLQQGGPEELQHSQPGGLWCQLSSESLCSLHRQTPLNRPRIFFPVTAVASFTLCYLFFSCELVLVPSRPASSVLARTQSLRALGTRMAQV